MKYDYIIAGSGCAGLSLLYRMLKDPQLCNKQILVIDKSQKNKNDRTWCFWEKGNGLFESIVMHQWKTLEFLSDDFQKSQLKMRVTRQTMCSILPIFFTQKWTLPIHYYNTLKVG